MAGKVSPLVYLRRLEEATTQEEVREHSSQVLGLLSEHEDLLVTYLLMEYRKLLRFGVYSHLFNQEGYHEVDIFPYRDEDGRRRVALFVAFLQDYQEVNDDLDSQVLTFLLQATERLHLEEVVNDISVNALQARGGKLLQGGGNA